jgi:WD40 repeat protein
LVAASIALRDAQLTAEAQQRAALVASLRRSEAQRLAAEAYRILQEGGSAELIALLAIHSVQRYPTLQGEEVIDAAGLLEYPVRLLRGHTNRIYAVAYAPDGGSVITAGQDLQIIEWESTTGTMRRTFQGHTRNIRSLAYAPDSTWFASAADDGLVCVWSRDGTRIAVLPHSYRLIGLLIMPNGYELLTWGDEPTIMRWNAMTGEVLATYRVPIRTIEYVALEPDGLSILAGGIPMDTVYRCTLADGALDVVAALQNCLISRLLYSSNGAWMLAIRADGADVQVLDAQTYTVQQTLRYGGVIETATFTMDNQAVISSGSDAKVHVTRISDGHELRCFAGHQGSIWSHAGSPDDRYILSGSIDGTACLWQVNTEPLVHRWFEHVGKLQGACFVNDIHLVTASEHPALRLWELHTGQIVCDYVGQPEPMTHNGLDYSPQAGQFAVGCNDGKVRIWAHTHPAPIRELQGHRGRIWGVAWSPDGRYVASTSSDRTVRVWDARHGDMMAILEGHTDIVVGVAWSPDGQQLLTGSDDGSARLWDLQRGLEIQRLVCHPHTPMPAVAIDPTGRYALTGGGDGSLWYWDLANGSCMTQLRRHSAYIMSVRFAADGRFALSASHDRRAILWDLATGSVVRCLMHRHVVTSAVFHPDQQQILTTSGDGQVRLWAISIDNAISRVRQRLLRDLSPAERVRYSIEETPDMSTV